MTEGPRSPLLKRPGAVEAGETGVASHYGQPLVEQRALHEGRALVDLSHQGILTVSGVDRLTWLDSMTSQSLARLQPAESAETLLLDPNGRIQHAIRIVDDGERAWLLVDEGATESLLAFLNRMRFTLRVDVQDVSEQYAAVLAFEGELLDDLRDVLDVRAEWRDPWSELQAGGYEYSEEGEDHPSREGWSPTRLVLPRSDLDRILSLVADRAYAVAGTLGLTALEIQAWRPSLSGDVDERAIPNEFDWLRSAVHMAKGCYRGQETVAKVHNLGHPPRRFTMLHLDGASAELPESGALIRSAGEPESRPIGRITRAALHYEWGGIALALLKRTAPVDSEVDVELASGGTVRAAQQIIVPPTAGATRNVPRLPRLG